MAPIIARAIGTTKGKAALAIDLVGQLLVKNLLDGKPISLPLVGTFYPVPGFKRRNFNPSSKKMEEMWIHPSVTFRANGKFKALLRGK